MTDPRHIQIKDFNYPLPDSRIAIHPEAERDKCKLLVYRQGEISHTIFSDIPQLLPSGSLLIYNNTRVIQARMHFRKATGAQIEVFLLEPHQPKDYEQVFQSRGQCEWVCMIGNLKKWRSSHEPLSRTISLQDKEVELQVSLGAEEHTGHVVTFTWSDSTVSFAELLEAIGQLPIPPYLNRDTEQSDTTDYQTVYSRIKGSVAAPTAGLHFTDEVLADVDSHGITRDEVTLHVGAGTFKPVKSELIEGHEMHQEFIVVRRDTIASILDHAIDVTAVGTTSVRTLESLYYIGCKIMDRPDISESELTVEQWEPYDNPRSATSEQALQAIVEWMDRHQLTSLHTSTRIIIAPGYTYHIVKRLITNFHQPQSTLLLLVCAFIGERWHDVYRYALEHDFRFLSYGDSQLLIP